MASDNPTPPMVNEKHASNKEDEIQELTSSTKVENGGNENVEIKAKEEDFPEPSETAPRESAEIEGTTTVTNPESQYPTGIRFTLLTISLMLGTYMVALDTNIICIQLPPSTPTQKY